MTPEEKIAAIETELAAVKKNRDSILREKRELEGRSTQAASNGSGLARSPSSTWSGTETPTTSPWHVTSVCCCTARR